MQILVAVVVSFVITGIAVLFRLVFPKKDKQRESAQATIADIAVENVCAFCGKPVGLDIRWHQKMHRKVKSEVVLMGNRTIYENIEVKLPCCHECEALNRQALNRATKRSLIAAVAAAAVVAACGVRSGVRFESFQDLFVLLFWGAFILFIIGFLAYCLFRHLVKPAFEYKIRKHALIVALSNKGWEMGEAPGLPTDAGNTVKS